ncbi:hypothetical protein Poly30_34350 [Planctomycetes bacterium Poly30]|uniref:Nickel uptake substrate-specific transmembrane region n=1 Tax=Saltatorellus ferox TaxID=2528018 RepID=A0A518EUX8_9BACT|nr:hypothetical protein Poly30_34350 [Planctomycetes bacterium Poly30]
MPVTTRRSLALLLSLAGALLALGWFVSRSGEGGLGVESTRAPVVMNVAQQPGEPDLEVATNPEEESRGRARTAPSMALSVSGDETASDRLRTVRTRTDGPQLVGRVVGADGQPVDGAECLFSTRRNFQAGGVPLGFEFLPDPRRAGVVTCTTEGGGVIRISGKERDLASGELPLVRLQPGADLAGLIRKPGFVPRRIEGVTVSDVRPHDLGEVRLERAAVLRGVVEDGNGAPIAGAKLTLHQPLARGSVVWRAEGLGLDVGVTDGEGRFRCDEVRSGPFELLVDTAAAPTVTVRGEALESSGGAPLRVVVRNGASVSGSVTGLPQDRRIRISARQLASACGSDGALRPRFAEVDPRDGSFTVTGLVAKGPVWLSAVEAETSEQRAAGAPVPEIRGVESVAGLRSAVLEWQPRATGRGRVMVPSASGEPVPLTNYTVSIGAAPANESPFPARPLQEGGAVKRHHPGGRFEFDAAAQLGSQEAQANLRIRASGYAEFVRLGVPFSKGRTTDFGDMLLTPDPPVRVRVVDSGILTPLQGAGVYLSVLEIRKEVLRGMAASGDPCWGSSHVAFAESGDDGMGELCAPAAGSAFWLAAHADGYLDSEPIMIQRGPDVVTLELTRGATVEVKVRTPSGSPVPGITVRILKLEDFKRESATPGAAADRFAVTGQTGIVRFRGLPGEAHIVAAIPPEVRDISRQDSEDPFRYPKRVVQAPLSGEATVELELRAPVTFEGRVIQNGVGLEGVCVTLHVRTGRGLATPGAGASALRTVTVGDGRFRFAGVPSYIYFVMVEHESRAMPAPFPIEVVRGMEPVVLELPDTRIYGRVLRAGTGDPVEGATVELWARGLPSSKIETGILRAAATGGTSATQAVSTPGVATTDVFGEFLFEGVATGRELRLKVTAQGIAPREQKLKVLSGSLTEQEVTIEVERSEAQEDK